MSKTKTISSTEPQTKWVNDLSLSYPAKLEKKKVTLPSVEIHNRLSTYVHTAQSLLETSLEPNKPSKRNYLAASFSFVVSDCGHERGGKHGRTVISFDVHIPSKAIFNAKDISPALTNKFQQTGYHTEQVLYAYLKTEIGQAYILKEFKKAEAQAVTEGVLQPLKSNQKRKIYAQILDIYSLKEMCDPLTADYYIKQGMACSCITATLAMQDVVKNNLRAETANTFYKAGYQVSGYDTKGKPIPGKTPLKMVTRVACNEIYPQNKSASQKPLTLTEKVGNHFNNQLILHHHLPLPPSTEVTVDACKNVAANITIFRSSDDNGLKGALDHYIGQLSKDESGNVQKIRKLIISFPNEMIRANLMDEIFANDILVRKLPKTLSKFVEKHNTASLKDGLYNAFVRVGEYEKTQQDFLSRATLAEENYGARDKFSKAFVCYPDEEGYTYLWGLKEAGDIETLNQIAQIAGLTRGEIKAAIPDSHCEVLESLRRMQLSDPHKSR